ncbi:MAG TPA: UDP-N-acetylmuramoyl-tripeptide--D-alanyl-D-alanine ligase [Gammaproteobacteria bacterium]
MAEVSSRTVIAEGISATFAQAATWVNGRLLGRDGSFHGAGSDSRSIAMGMLFIALRGPNHDGHDHVAAAAACGAAAALVERELPVPIPQIIVTDTHAALGLLGAAWRQRLGLPLVAITGSNGKTTVKEMTAAILSRAGTTLATRGNLNNDIGVPLTLMRLDESYRYGVIEMGANHPGEIAYLTNLVRPQVAVITNAGAAHLEGFGSIEGVARAKGEIYSGLAAEGCAVINADDAHAELWRTLAANCRVLSFGIDKPADVSAQWQGDVHGSRLQLSTPAGQADVKLALPGRHNVLNALAATAAALAMGVGLDAVVAGLQGLAPVGGRMQIRQGLHGATIIDDSYNANPVSLRAGIDVLAACQGRRYLALGDMGELGADTERHHAEAGTYARQVGIDGLYATGPLSRLAVEAFGERGYHFADQQQLISALKPELDAGVTVLVKGSRSSRMEWVVAGLTEVQK